MAQEMDQIETKFDRNLKILSKHCLLQYSKDHYQIFYFGRNPQAVKSKNSSNKPNREFYMKSLAKDTTLGQISNMQFDNSEHFKTEFQNYRQNVAQMDRFAFSRPKRKCIMVDD